MTKKIKSRKPCLKKYKNRKKFKERRRLKPSTKTTWNDWKSTYWKIISIKLSLQARTMSSASSLKLLFRYFTSYIGLLAPSNAAWCFLSSLLYEIYCRSYKSEQNELQQEYNSPYLCHTICDELSSVCNPKVGVKLSFHILIISFRNIHKLEWCNKA